MQGLNQILKDNVNVNKPKTNNVKRYNVTGLEVHRIATNIAEKLGDHASVAFFCKAAWQIPEYQLMNFLEQAERGHSPARYFTWLCTQELRKLKSL